MEFVPFHNKKPYAIFVGNTLIPADETRLVDQRLVSVQNAAKEIAIENQDPLLELLKNPIQAVIAALPDLTIEEITRLGELEQQGQARKGVLGPLAEILLIQSSDHAGSGEPHKEEPSPKDDKSGTPNDDPQK